METQIFGEFSRKGESSDVQTLNAKHKILNKLKVKNSKGIEYF